MAASRGGAKTTLVEAARSVGLDRTLMPFMISEGWSEAEVVVPDARSLEGAGVEVRTSERVVAVSHLDRRAALEPSSREGARGLGRSIGFDSVVVCTGSASEVPRLRGVTKPNVYVLRGPSDYLGLSVGLSERRTVAVSGPLPLALRLAEVLAGRGVEAMVYCGKGGLERQFSGPLAKAIRREASRARRGGRTLLLDGSIDSILGAGDAEAVLSEGEVRTCDAVVLVPWSAPAFPAIQCEKGHGGGLLVDSAMSTSAPGIFAAGDCAEIRFKAGSVPARLRSTSRMGGEVAGTNAAGGKASASPSWAVEQTYFGLEFCSAGFSEAEARAMGLEAATEASESASGPARSPKVTLVSMVYDLETHQVYGIQVAGWRASALASAASLVVSQGIRAEQLVHAEFPYSPGVSHETSPISLTAARIIGRQGGVT